MDYETFQRLGIEQGDIVRIDCCKYKGIIRVTSRTSKSLSYMNITKKPKNQMVDLERITSLEKLTKKLT